MICWKGVNSLVFLFLNCLLVCSSFGAVRESAVFAGVPSDGQYGSPFNSFRSFAASGGYLLGRRDITGSIQGVNAADWALEGEIEVRHPNGQVRVVRMFTQTSYVGVLPGTASVFVSPGTSSLGVWQFRFYESLDDDGIDKVWTTFRTDFTDEFPTPPSSTNLGAACDPGGSWVQNVAPNQIRWFRVALASPTVGVSYFDIDTEGSAPYDTEIALYTQYGELIATDDDDGDGFRSQLTFGLAATPRGRVGNGMDYDGRDGDLSAGTYYIALGIWNCNFDPAGFSTSSESLASGDLTLNIQTNLACGSPVTGNVVLGDYAGDKTEPVVVIELRAPGSLTPLETHIVSLDSTGMYSFILQSPPGTYDIACKASHWLRKTLHSVAVPTATNINFALVNGDIIADNEINLGDYAALARAFGTVPDDAAWDSQADLDGDLEITLADYSTLSRQFGAVGDD